MWLSVGCVAVAWWRAHSATYIKALRAALNTRLRTLQLLRQLVQRQCPPMEVVEKLSDTDAPRSPQLETPVDQDQVIVDDNLHDAFDNPLAATPGQRQWTSEV